MVKYIASPNLPVSKVNTVVVDFRAGDEILKSLKELNIEVIKTINCNELYDSIKGHPDILFHHIGGNSIVLAPNIYEKLSLRFIKKGFAVTKGDAWLRRNYPYNIAYNVLRIGDYAFHNLKYTDKQIRLLYEKAGINFYHINQGYAKCSVAPVNDKAAITSDEKIADVLEKCGIESLLIKPGGIDLKELNYGFIGGASGLISDGEIAFTGSLHEIKDYKRIQKFLNEKGVSVKILSSKKIIDIGSIIPLTY